jgi:phosphatidylserine synthase
MRLQRRSGGALRTLTGWTVGPVGLKDLFTLVNLVSGVFAVHYAFTGEVRRAGYAVIVGFLLGDLVDGSVARATGTGNRFGAQFDTVTDHFVHVLVPGIVLYAVYARAGHDVLGAIALTLLLAAASIRHALFAVRSFDFALCWCGLPRTIAGFGALALPLSRTFGHLPARYPAGLGVVGTLCALCVLPVPYITHRGRGLQWYLKLILVVFVASFPLAFLFARSWFFDVLLLWVVGYATLGWFGVRPHERRLFYEEYRRWSVDVAV